jgi:hypothetical protein
MSGPRYVVDVVDGELWYAPRVPAPPLPSTIARVLRAPHREPVKGKRSKRRRSSA